MSTVYHTLAEVWQNNGKTGANTWIIVKDNVYDVTSYLNEHPGGSELVEEWAGKDATKAFNDVGHSGDAKGILKGMKIGELAETDRTHCKNGNNFETSKLEDPNMPRTRSCISVISCGLLG